MKRLCIQTMATGLHNFLLASFCMSFYLLMAYIPLYTRPATRDIIIRSKGHDIRKK